MKKIFAVSLLSLAFAACSQTNQSISTTNTNEAARTSSETGVVSSHSTGNGKSPTATANSNGAKSPVSPGGSPMAKAIDVSPMSAAIEKAEKSFNAKPNDAKAKNDLAEAYFARAFALTEAAQYRSALGDFRRGLKLNPNDDDAKKMLGQIIGIFQSIGREPPKEGEEPPPLPFDKGNQTAAQTVEKINFAPDAISAIAAGNLNNYDDSKTFVIAVRQGQTLRTEQVKDDKSLKYVTVSIKNPAGEFVGDSDASCNDRKEIAPTAAGDYTLQVVECKKAGAWRGDFKLKVSVK